GKELGRVRGDLVGDRPDFVEGLAAAPGGTLFATTSQVHPTRIWDTNTRKKVHELEGVIALRLAFDPKGRSLVAADRTGYWGWDTATGKRLSQVRFENEASSQPMTLFIFPDGARLAVLVGADLVIFDLASGKEVHRHAGVVGPVALAPDGKLLVWGNSLPDRDEPVRLIDTVAWQEVGTLEGHKGAVRDIAFAPDGKAIATT